MSTTEKLINGIPESEYKAYQARYMLAHSVRQFVERKGTFPFDATYRGSAYDWSSPTPNGYGITYGGTVDYAVEVGDLIDNSAIMACLLWIMRTFPEAPLRVMKRQRGNKPVEVEDHALTKLWRHPNPYYSGRLLQQPSLLSFNWRGETYIRKIRNPQGQIIRLYYEPHWTCRPVRKSAEDFISNYQLYRDNKWVDVAVKDDVHDIVHIRHGLDPENPMHGLSPLASLLREVFTDNAAARYASSVMMKLGVLGAIVTPKEDGVGIEEPEKLKAMLQAISTGDQRGSYGVFSEPLDFHWPDNDPSKMDTRANRKITEERISGALGVPAIVAGLGAGLDRSTFANMAEAREMAYESNIIPTHSLWADELNTQLLNELGDPDTEFVDWDYSRVRVLQDDENKKANKYAVLYAGGIIKRSEARADLGYDVTPEDEMYKQAASPPPAFDAMTNPDNPDVPKAIQVNGVWGIPVGQNGNGSAHDILWEGKARKPSVDSVTDDIMEAVGSEIERLYEEAAKAIG